MKTTSKRHVVSSAEPTIIVDKSAAKRRTVQVLFPSEPAFGFMIDFTPQEGVFEYKWCPAYESPLTLELGPGQHVAALAFDQHAVITVLVTEED